MLKKAIAKTLLTKLPVSHNALMGAGFSKKENDYHFANLVIYEGLYFYNLDGERQNVKNMQEVSNLIYGHKPFLDMSNGR